MMLVLTDRLERLPQVWGEWEVFDAGAFFDLYPEQTEVLVDIQETHSRVRVTFFADVLVPAFREAEAYWLEQVVPALHVAQPALMGQGDFHWDAASETWARLMAQELAPAMETALYRAAHEIQRVREVLYEWGDVAFFVATAGMRERQRVIHSGSAPLPPRLKERLHLIPTLTLQLTFAPNLTEKMTRRRIRMRQRRYRWRRSRAC